MKGCALAPLFGICIIAWVMSRNPYIHPLAILLILAAGGFVAWALFGQEETVTKASRRWHKERFGEWQSRKNEDESS